MQACRQLKGVIPVVQTPVHRDGAVDTESLTRLIEFLNGTGVGGYWALGTGSEDMNLSFEKRLTVARTITKANAGRLPLILGSSFFAMDDILAFMDATKNLEFDAYHVMPYHPLLGLDGMEKFYKDIADRAPKPLWMYTSANWCRAFPPEFFEKLKSHKNIAGVKFSSSRTTDQIKVIGLAERDFQVITAVASQFIMVLGVGVAACDHKPGRRAAGAAAGNLQSLSAGPSRRGAGRRSASSTTSRAACPSAPRPGISSPAPTRNTSCRCAASASPT